ncbi:MAG: hypothetical protein E2P02_08595 [Acidobacteria bacterium]|nr:MAG: hypothetical protein E2P02_08595 [Acidobacteriota bacterium]
MGFEVSLSSHPSAGLEALQDGTLDVLVLDVMAWHHRQIHAPGGGVLAVLLLLAIAVALGRLSARPAAHRGG